RLDAVRGLEPDRCDLLGTLEDVVAPFEVGLVAVRGEHSGRAHRPVAGDRREAAAGDRVVGDGGGVDGGGDVEDGLLVAPVAGVLAGAATVFLPVGDLAGLADLVVDPAGGPGRGQRGGGGGFGGGAGLEPGLGAVQAGLQRLDGGEPGLDAGGAGRRVAGGLG